MVFVVVASDSDAMPPFIFLHGLTPKMETYTKCLEELVFTWIERVAAKKPYVWQQDTTPCHTSKKTEFGLSKKITLSLESDRLNYRNSIPLIIMYGLKLSKWLTKLWAIQTTNGKQV